MSVTRTILEYDNDDQPKKENEITVKYAGFLYDEVMHCCGQWVGFGWPSSKTEAAQQLWFI